MDQMLWRCELERRFVTEWENFRLVVETPLPDRSFRFLVFRKLGGLLSSGYRNTVADALRAAEIAVWRVTRNVQPRSLGPTRRLRSGACC